MLVRMRAIRDSLDAALQVPAFHILSLVLEIYIHDLMILIDKNQNELPTKLVLGNHRQAIS